MLETVFEYYYFFRHSRIEMRRLVFMDESHTNDRSTQRTHGNSLRGVRPVFRYFMVRGVRYTLSVAANDRGIVDHMIFRGSCTGSNFMFWILRSLYFALEDDSILVMDNAAIHHYQPVTVLLEYLGVRVIYLPPYCCFLNPVEHIFAAVKAYVRRYRDLMLRDPVRTLGAIVDGLRNFDVYGLMRRMGYHRVCL